MRQNGAGEHDGLVSAVALVGRAHLDRRDMHRHCGPLAMLGQRRGRRELSDLTVRRGKFARAGSGCPEAWPGSRPGKKPVETARERPCAAATSFAGRGDPYESGLRNAGDLTVVTDRRFTRSFLTTRRRRPIPQITDCSIHDRRRLGCQTHHSKAGYRSELASRLMGYARAPSRCELKARELSKF